MSYKISKSSLYLRDKENKLNPVGIFSSGAEKSLQEIKSYATEKVNAAKSDIDAKAAATLDTIPVDYTALAEEVNELKGHLGGLTFSINDNSLVITNGTKTWTLNS